MYWADLVFSVCPIQERLNQFDTRSLSVLASCIREMEDSRNVQALTEALRFESYYRTDMKWYICVYVFISCVVIVEGCCWRIVFLRSRMWLFYRAWCVRWEETLRYFWRKSWRLDYSPFIITSNVLNAQIDGFSVTFLYLKLIKTCPGQIHSNPKEKNKKWYFASL